MSGAVRLSFRCPCGAERPVEVRSESPAGLPVSSRCGSCARESAVHTERRTAGGGLVGCLACGHPELYTRKSFPAAAGILVVVVAAILAPATKYLSLVAAALVDFALYRWVPDVVVCYACGAEHRGFAGDPWHPRFDREIEERLKFGPRAVMGKPMRPGGTAGAPDPEH